jgi:hypothetical protein
MLKAGKKYHGTVATGSELIQSNSGTLGYQVQLECEDGAAEYVIWLTPKNKERAQKTFEDALGVTVEKLYDGNYIELQMAADIAGREVTFVTTEEEYKGKFRVKVSFLFKRSALAGASPGKAVAAFFGKGVGPVTETNPIDDAEIPF